MSDYETKQKKRNIVVGLFVIIGFCALVWLILKFGDMPGFVSKLDSFQIFVQFPTASGVQKDTPVNFCGYQIGRVTKVMAPDIREELDNGVKTGRLYYQTVVVLSIDKKYQTIPCNVKVKMMRRGLGSSFIEIEQCPDMESIPLDPNRPETMFLYDGAYLQGSTGMTSEFFPEESQEKLSELIEGLKTFIDNSNNIIGDPENQNNFKTTLANLTEVSEQAKYTLKEFEELAASGESTLKHVETKLDEIVTVATNTTNDIRAFVNTGTEVLKSTDDNIEELVKSIVVSSEELGRATSQLRLIMEKVNNGQGTASRLINDPRLYEKLLDDTEQLEELLESMKSLIEKIEEKGLSKVWSGK